MYKSIMNSCLYLSLLFCVVPPAQCESKNRHHDNSDPIAFLNKSIVKTDLLNLTHQKELQRFSAIGKSTFSFMFWDLYNSTLLTTTGNYPVSFENEKLIFQIEYLMDIKKSDLIKKTIEQWQHIGLKKTQYSRYIKNLEKIWPNIIKGDSLSLLMQKNMSVFYYNDSYLGQINDPYFGQIFIDIWLSNKTSQPNLRAELLGVTP